MEFLSQVVLTDAYRALVAALIFSFTVVAGYIVAKILSGITKDTVKRLKIEKQLKGAGVGGNIVSVSLPDLTGFIVGLYVFLLSVALGAHIAHIPLIVAWCNGAMTYMVSAVQGIIILSLGFLIGGYLSNAIVEGQKESIVHKAVAFFIELFIGYNALVISLPMLLPNSDVSLLKSSFLVVLFGISFGGALALGISVGLGAKDIVKKKIGGLLKNETK